MTINLSVPSTHELKPRITVIGVGGAGGNAVNNMITSHLEGVEFVAANTDAQALSQSLTERRIQLGSALTRGLGAGAQPDIGRAAAEEAIDQVLEHLQGCNMVFITAGMGGGTGTGATSVMARAAREQGILTVGVVTKPFQFEGSHRMRIAEAGIAELQQYVDTLIIIPNQNLFRIANEKTTFADAFRLADDVLYSGVRGVTDLMVMPGLINLDFADVRSVMSEMGKAMMGTGEADGEKRALDAAEAAIHNPLLDDVSLKGAHGVLINITGGPDMTLYEVDEAANHIRDQVDPEANIIFGSTFDESLAGRVRISVVATGIETDQRSARAEIRSHIAEHTSAEPAVEHAAAPDEAMTEAAEHAASRMERAGPETASLDLPEPEDQEPAEPTIPAFDIPVRIAERTASRMSGTAEQPKRPAAAGPTVQPELRPAAPATQGHARPATTASGEASEEEGERESLFWRITRSARPRPAAVKSEGRPAAAREQETRGATDTLVMPRREEDTLDIPAFLRRRDG